MNVWDHLTELRKRLLISIYTLFGCTALGFLAVDPLLEYLAKPVGALVFIQPTEAFAVQLKVAIAVGLLIGLPVFLYQIWAFVGAGLHMTEKRYIRWVVPLSYVLFLSGVAVAVFLIFPRAMQFLVSLQSEYLQPMITAQAYIDFFFTTAFVIGVFFELPLVLHFLAKVGVLRPDFLAGNRRMFYLLFFVIGTLLNGSPDVFTQIFLGSAGIALFEFSILLMKFEWRRKAKA
jgi:sec-independent protein translocase protein TatC